MDDRMSVTMLTLWNELKILTEIHGNNLSDSVTKFLFVNVVVVIQHLRASGKWKEGHGIAEVKLLSLFLVLSSKRRSLENVK